jgi:hypothetical protein
VTNFSYPPKKKRRILGTKSRPLEGPSRNGGAAAFYAARHKQPLDSKLKAVCELERERERKPGKARVRTRFYSVRESRTNTHTELLRSLHAGKSLLAFKNEWVRCWILCAVFCAAERLTGKWALVNTQFCFPDGAKWILAVFFSQTQPPTHCFQTFVSPNTRGWINASKFKSALIGWEMKILKLRTHIFNSGISYFLNAVGGKFRITLSQMNKLMRNF